MIERRTLSVSLTPELHAFIAALVQDGAYGNSSEVVRAGLRLLRREEGDHRLSQAPVPLTTAEPRGAKG